jgi:hypothetical protein
MAEPLLMDHGHRSSRLFRDWLCPSVVVAAADKSGSSRCRTMGMFCRSVLARPPASPGTRDQRSRSTTLGTEVWQARNLCGVLDTETVAEIILGWLIQINAHLPLARYQSAKTWTLWSFAALLSEPTARLASRCRSGSRFRNTSGGRLSRAMFDLRWEILWEAPPEQLSGSI